MSAAELRVYKIADRYAWDNARATGRFLGSADDVRDGYIHLSSAGQVADTLAKHFAGVPNLVLVEINAQMLGTALAWEAGRDGALFPHLYAPLDVAAVLREMPLNLVDGRHWLPLGWDAC